MAILLLTNDLMASSRAAGTARQSGTTLHTVANSVAALQQLQEAAYSLAIVDLTTVGSAIGALVEDLKRIQPELSIMAYGPHVQEHLLEAARSAGCDRVLTRGQFHAQMTEIIGGKDTV
jgi:CheY-like chemotaxis protein